jgi:haloalkane dehalogenase
VASNSIGSSVPDLHHREAGDPANPAVLLVHGYPESSHMWEPMLEPLAASGFHALAPDLAGFGDSEADPPGTWQRHVEALERFRAQRDLDRCALVVHDWGGLIGLRWACEHPEVPWALVISDTGFFPDGQWHGLAEAMRSEQGEQLVDTMTEQNFAAMLGGISSIGPEAAREYFKAFADEDRRRGQLELYRSGDFSELEAYDGKLAQLGVPTLLLWGADDPFAPLASAHRFEREIPGSALVILDSTGHFVVDDAPERYAGELVRFLKQARPDTAR